MIKTKKRFFALFLIAYILFYSSFGTYYQTKVYAMGFVETVVGGGTLLKALFGLLGITVAVGSSQVDWNVYADDAVNYMNNNANTAVDVSKWWNNALHGAIDTASECWGLFKDWVNNLISGGGSGDVSSGSIGVSLPAYTNDLLPAIKNFVGYSSNVYTDNTEIYFYFFAIRVNDNSIPNRCLYLFRENYPLSCYIENGYLYFDNSVGHYSYLDNRSIISGSNTSDVTLSSNNISSRPVIYLNNDFKFFLSGNIDISSISSFGDYDFTILDSDFSVDSDFNSIVNNITNLTIINKSAVSDMPGTVTIPWDVIGSNDEAINEKLDEFIELVNEGVLSPSDYVEQVQEITNVYTYDISTDYIFPNGENDNETIDDKVQENVNREGFTLAGLENFFPFCIPFDIYAFLNILVADPTEPIFNIPVQVGFDSDSIEYVTIDLTPLDSYIQLIHYIMDFLFIIGLSLITRGLIGAGGGSSD